MKKEKYYFLINSLEAWWAERATVNFSNDLIKKWKEVYIITLKSERFYNLPKWANHIKLSKIKNNFLLFLLIPIYCIRFKKILRKNHLKEGMSLLEISNFIHILSKKHATISFRTNMIFFRWFKWLLQRILIKLLYPRAKKIITNSKENSYDLTKYLKISENKIQVIYNKINKNEFDKLKRERIDKNLAKEIKNKNVFITVGRLIKQKHHNKIIIALKKINEELNKNWIYLIVWDWPERKNLEKLSHKLWLKNKIIFLWQQKNVFKHLNIADIFLYASEVEWFPNVLLEAKEMWLPIITSDFKSGAKEIILWEYNKKIWEKIRYPYEWKYGYLIDINNYKSHLIKAFNLLKTKI